MPDSARASWWIIALFGAFATLFALLVPAWEAPDEPSHLRYIDHLHQHGTLPHQLRDNVGTAHHPPLYYALGALVTLPVDRSDPRGAYTHNPRFTWGSGPRDQQAAHLHRTADTFPFVGHALALRLTRLLSVLLSTGVVLFAYAAARRLFATPLAPEFAALLIALLPQFVFIGSSALNDNLLNLFAAACVYLVIRLLQGDAGAGHRAWAALGVICGLAALSKISGVVLLPLALIALALQHLPHRDARQSLRALAALSISFVLIAGWWFARNVVLYGDPTGNAAWVARFGDAVRGEPPDLGFALHLQFLTFVARFGWNNVGLPRMYYDAVAALGAIALGAGGILLARRWRTLATGKRLVVIWLVVAILLQQALLLREIQRWTTADQGRYLFPVIVPIALLTGFGIAACIPPALRAVVAGALAVMGSAVLVHVLWGAILPAYPAVTPHRLSLYALPTRGLANFENIMHVHGYRLGPMSPDGKAELTVTLQAAAKPTTNYATFVHVLPVDAADDAPQVAGFDQVPGAARGYLPLNWAADDIIIDTRVITFPAGDAAQYKLRFGVYDPDTGARLTAQLPDGQLTTLLMLR